VNNIRHILWERHLYGGKLFTPVVSLPFWSISSKKVFGLHPENRVGASPFDAFLESEVGTLPDLDGAREPLAPFGRPTLAAPSKSGRDGRDFSSASPRPLGFVDHSLALANRPNESVAFHS
jgi:hypothetical protein